MVVLLSLVVDPCMLIPKENRINTRRCTPLIQLLLTLDFAISFLTTILLFRKYLAIALSVILTAGIVLIDGNISNAFRRYVQPRHIVYNTSCRCEHRSTQSVMVYL